MLSHLLIQLIRLTGLPVLLTTTNPDAHSDAQNLAREVTNRVYLASFWQAYTPSPDANYDSHYGDDSDWFTLPSNIAGEELSTSGDKIGYRLRDDDCSAIVYHLSPNNIIFQATYLYDSSKGQDGGPSVQSQVTLTASYVSITYPSNSSTQPSDVWNSNDTIPITLNKTIKAQNVDCDSGMNITITTLDATGQTLVYTGTDAVSAPVPGSLPANVTISNDLNSGSAVLEFSGNEPVSASFGKGNVPVPKASLVAVVQFCPD